MEDRYRFLRKVPLFAGLSDADLEQICQQAKEIHLAAGELLFSEGDMGHQAFIIESGQIEIYKASSGKSYQLAVRKPGEVIGEMAILEAAPRMASGRALAESVVLAIYDEHFERLLNTSPTAARVILNTVTSRLKSTEAQLRQNEKMAQLGSFTAGIAHEFNNPATAVLRGAEHLRTAFQDYQAASMALKPYAFAGSLERLHALDEKLRGKAQAPLELDPITRSDVEAALEEWLDARGFERAWDLAPQLVSAGFGPGEIARLEADFPGEGLALLVAWITSGFTIYQLLYEIGHGANRIAEIVKALKAYIYLDQGPVQEVNIHEGLENTLVILRYKLKQGIEVVRDFAPSLPPIQAHGSELNQVWTNIIDNAIDAVTGATQDSGTSTRGRITIKTVDHGAWVVVDIMDNGPGIPEEMQAKLFSPFFTTKPVGKGTGLGLNISYNIIQRHGGDIRVQSRPGETHFEIWLPRRFQGQDASPQTLPKE